MGTSERSQSSSTQKETSISSSYSASFISKQKNLHPDSRDRRRLVQRCRLLKADILRFEANFRASSIGGGRDPKTATEREPMAEVYEEYRSLKHTIRDGAALHIQAVYRGHSTRRRLGRSRTTTTTATTTKALVSRSQAQSATNASDSSLSAISGDSMKKTASSIKPSVAGAASTSSLPPPSLHSAPAPEMLKLSALRDEKAALKRKLRQFDIDFSANNDGRLPTKAEKEHLRPQYTRYHELKTIISETESRLGVNKEAESPTRESSSRRDAAGAPSALSFGTHTEKVSSTGGASQSRSRSDSGSSAGNVGIDDDDDDESAAASVAGQKQEVQDKIAMLKTEKKKLQVALREYEKDFLARNGRPVRYVKDISSVVQSYQRYKQLKQQLKELIG